MGFQLFSPSFRVEECLAAIKECLEKGWTGLGYKTLQIEEKWCEYTGLPYAHFLNSNTSGLHLALHMFKTKYNWIDNDEVISTPLTFVSTNHAILYNNLRPVFADVDEYLCLDPESVLLKITPRTRAVIFVGMGGNTGQYEKIVALCKEKGLLLILDAAHMSGTRLHGKHVGAEANCSVFSFQAVKNLATADAGMICFQDQEDDERARKLTWLGINKDTYTRTVSQGSYKWMYDVEEIGFKYHGNSIMAAIALVSLRYLDEDNAYRRQLAQWYTNHLKNIIDLTIVPIAINCESSQHLFQIRVPQRDKVLLYLQSQDIYPGVHYQDNTNYKMYQYGKGSCPVAHLISNETISLPLHLRLNHIDIEHISKAVIASLK